MPWHRNSVTRAGRPESSAPWRIGLPGWWRRRSRSGRCRAGAAPRRARGGRPPPARNRAGRSDGARGTRTSARRDQRFPQGGARGPMPRQRRGRTRCIRPLGPANTTRPSQIASNSARVITMDARRTDTSPAPRCRRPVPEQKAAAPQRRDFRAARIPTSCVQCVVQCAHRDSKLRGTAEHRADANRRGSAAIAVLIDGRH